MALFKAELRLQPGDWYVVHSYAGYENRVRTNLESRTQSLNMEDFIYQIEVPVHEVTEIKRASASRSRRRCCPATSWSGWTLPTSPGPRSGTHPA